MLNRFKLLVLAIIFIVLTALFLQNQEPLSLKFFCPDNESEYCFYQTPEISLAVWMAMSILSGIFLSLVWQVLNRSSNSSKRERYSSSQSSKTSSTRTSYREQSKLREEAESNRSMPNNFKVSDWEQSRSDNWENPNVTNFAKDYKVPATSSQDTTDSNKFPKDGQSNLRTDWTSKSRPKRSSKENVNPENTKPPVAQNKEEVYDANYRTLNDVPPPSSSKGAVTEEEDSDWI